MPELATCPVCRRRWLSTPNDHITSPDCGCYGYPACTCVDWSAPDGGAGHVIEVVGLCEPCALAHAEQCPHMAEQEAEPEEGEEWKS